MKQVFSFFLFCLASYSIHAQQGVAINTDGAKPSASAILDVKSSTKGLLLPRMTSAEKAAIPSPANGLLIYQTDGNPGFYYYNGAAWAPITSKGLLSDGWNLTGNAGTDSSANFIGTTDAQPLIGKAGGYQVFKFPAGAKGNAFFSGAGYQCGGTDNTAIGRFALGTATGSSNIAMGYGALESTLSGSNNTALGNYSMKENTSGNLNIALGSEVLLKNTSGSSNIALGLSSLYYNTSGNNNIALGASALSGNVTGSNNIGIGQNATVLYNWLTNTVAIGQNASVGYSNALALGAAATSGSALRVGIGTAYPAANLHIKQRPGQSTGLVLEDYGTSNFWRTSLSSLTNNYTFSYNNVEKALITYSNGAYVQLSDVRMKKDIRSIDNVLPKLLQLAPKSYHYKDNPEGAPLSFGFIAQEVEPLFPEFVTTNSNTGMKGIAYTNFGVIAVQAIKEQQTMIDELKMENALLKKDIVAIKEKLGAR